MLKDNYGTIGHQKITYTTKLNGKVSLGAPKGEDFVCLKLFLVKFNIGVLRRFQHCTGHTRPNPTKNTLSSFTPVSEEELLKILKSSPSKSCDLDPIPTSLVQECADILITPITKIVNYSIT